ncbi:MAG: competence protein TfoX [Ruminococcus sp.]|nr:competence protein TfoX [Ruminococcus sp.]
MATSKEFCAYIVEHLQKTGDISVRKMMGEYLVYYQGKLVGDICDNCLFLKPTESALRLLPDADRAYPYEGSKTKMIVVEDVENTELMAEILQEMYQELPEPKKKSKKQ